MATTSVKISQLPVLNILEANTANLLLVGVDVLTATTYQLTGTTLANGLYSNNPLVVGNNILLLSNTVGQFSGNDANFIQVNLQNFSPNGASDLVLTTDDGTNSNSYIDVGINNSKWNSALFGQSSQYAYDGYVIVQGPGPNNYGNLVIGTAVSGANLVFAVGGQLSNNIVAVMTANSLVMNTGSYITFADGSQQATSPLSGRLANAVIYSNASGNLSNTSSLQFISSNNTLIVAGNTNSSNITTNNITLTYITGNVLPTASNTWALGSANNRWGSLWLGANTLHLLDQITGNDSVIYVANSTLYLQNASTLTVGSVAIQANGTVITPNLLLTGNLVCNTTNSIIYGSTIYLTSNNANNQGALVVNNSTFSSNVSAVRIDGSAGFAAQQTTANGTMLQIIGKDGLPSRTLIDSYGTGAYGLIAGRTARGTAASPTSPQSGDLLFRIVGNGYGTTGYTISGGAAIDFVTIDNYSDTAKGSLINVTAAIVGTNTRVTAATFSAANTTFANTVILSSGNSSVVPLKYQPGNIAITAQTGSHEYDGNTYYFTPNDAERGVVPAQQHYIANTNFVLGANTSSQSLFGYGVSTSSNRRYAYKIQAVIQKVGNGANAPTVAYGLAGTAVLGAHQYQVVSATATSQTTPTTTNTLMSNYITTGFSTPVVATSAFVVSTGYMTIEIWGYVDVVTGGTIIPQITFSAAPTTSAYTQALSSMRIWPIQTALANTIVGNWSAG